MRRTLRNRELKIKATTFVRHRNGVSGEPFWQVCFTWMEPEIGMQHELTAIVFDDEKYVAIFDTEDWDRCWRGDQFEKPLRRAIAEYIRVTYDTPPEK